METPPRLVTTSNRPLALWQSAAEEVVRQHTDQPHLGRAELLSHDLLRATAGHAAGEHSDLARMSRHYFEQAEHMRVHPGSWAAPAVSWNTWWGASTQQS